MLTISPDITKVIAIDTTNPIVTPAEIGEWLNLSTGMVTKFNDMIQGLIDSTVTAIENYSWLYLRRTTFEAHFELGCNSFNSVLHGNTKLILQRAPILALADITKIEYLDTDGTYTEFDRGTLASEGLYENTSEKKEQGDYASIYFKEEVPFDTSRLNSYKIKVTFIAGFTTPGTGEPPTPEPNIITDVPEQIITAIKIIVAFYYTNRGDCSSAGCDIGGYPVPCPAKGLIDQLALSQTVMGQSYNTGNDVCGWC